VRLRGMRHPHYLYLRLMREIREAILAGRYREFLAQHMEQNDDR